MTPHDQMMRMITGYWVTQVVRGAAAVSLPEHLEAGPLSAQEVAEASPLHPDVAFRFLRACAAIGLVAPAPGGRFAKTPLLDTLRAADPRSLRGLALSQAAPGHWAPWGRFTDVLATGRRQTVEALGAEIFDYYSANPDEAAEFSRGMTGLTVAMARVLPRVLDTEGVTRVVDIGGAEGALLAGLLVANPRLAGTILDRPGVVESARRAIEKAGLADRISIVAGDFLAEVPGGDLYLLKHILHDWDDETCLTILRNCRRAASPGGRLAIIELALASVGEGGAEAPLLDLNMLVLTSGRERTFAEYESLLETAGFTNARARPTGTPLVVIEATVA